MKIPYIATNFTLPAYAGLNGSHSLTASWTDLVWSAITAGKPGASHLLAHRWHSLADMVVRTHTVYANLLQRGNLIDRSTLYDAMDPTEKGATSYFLGMVMAKLFSAKKFDTPWLFHVSQATANGATIRFKHGSKSQPDLIGQNRSGDWLVFEAKGRTNGLDANALTKAKSQTKMIRTVNKSKPHLRVALQAYFEDNLSVRLDDPPESDPEAVDVEIDLNAALSRYYSVATAIALRSQSRETFQGQEYVSRFDEDSGITIGVESSILSAVSAGNFSVLRERLASSGEAPLKSAENAAVYPDGLFVRLDGRWSQQLMALEPEERLG